MNQPDSPSAYENENENENDQMDEDDIQTYSHTSGGGGRDYESLETTISKDQTTISKDQTQQDSSLSEKDSKTIVHSDFKKSFRKAEKAMDFTFKIPAQQQ